MNKSKLKQILLLLLVMLPGVNVWGENNDNIKTIVIDVSKMSTITTSYANRTWADDAFSGICNNVLKTSTTPPEMRFRGVTDVYNETPVPGRIVSVKMIKTRVADSNWTVYVDENAQTKNKGISLGSKEVSGTTTWEIGKDKNYHYFYIIKGGLTSVTEISSIIIEYEAAVTTPTIDVDDCATFSSPLMLDLSKLEGVEAYIATGCDSEKVTMEKVTTTIPENTGVVLKSTSNKAKAFTIPTAAIASELNNNLLIATTAETVVEKAGNGTNWVLAGSGNSLGWYYIDNFTATLAAGKCYMHTEGTNPAKSSIEMSFEDNATSMDIVNYGANESCAVYNLAGQRVDNNAKGLVIINGKKVYKK